MAISIGINSFRFGNRKAGGIKPFFKFKKKIKDGCCRMYNVLL